MWRPVLEVDAVSSAQDRLLLIGPIAPEIVPLPEAYHQNKLGDLPARPYRGDKVTIWVSIHENTCSRSMTSFLFSPGRWRGMLPQSAWRKCVELFHKVE